MEPEFDVDVVVVGAGACGLVAALAAVDQGARVLVLEKLPKVGGNSSLSTGSIPAAGSRMQKAAGIADDPDRMATDLLQTSGPHEAEDLVRLMAEQSAELVHWLIDAHHIDLQLITDYKHVGHTVPRLHAPGTRDGAVLVRDLIAACQRQGVEIRTEHAVSALVCEDEKVVGVQVDEADGSTFIVRAGAVILASNGYGNNPELLNRWNPEITGAQYFGAEGSTGEAILWAEELGAEVANTGAYQGYAAVADTDLGAILSWTTVELGGIIVTPDGNRAGDESVGYSGFANVLSQQTPVAYAVFDARIRDYVASNEPRFVKLMDAGQIMEVSTVEELADAIHCDEKVLAETMAAARRAASGESVDPHGRTDFGLGPLQEPYVYAEVTPGLFHTQGGVRVDNQARVLRAGGEPIAGLYAGGGVAAGVSGRTGAQGYASGNGLLTAVGLGYISGRNSAGAMMPQH